MAESNGLDNSSKGSTDDKVALMSRKFKQLMKKKGNFQHSSRQKDTRFKKKHKEKSHEIICLKCKKPGHMKVKCPRLKRKKALQGQEKKSLTITQDDSDVRRLAVQMASKLTSA